MYHICTKPNAKRENSRSRWTTVEFYQHLSHILGPRLLKVYQEFFNKQTRPDRCNTSYNTRISKDGTAKIQLNNYRPISLLNTDYNILAKTLTNKLKTNIATLIHPDQQCSVQDRNIHHHTNFNRVHTFSTHMRNTAYPHYRLWTRNFC